MKSTLTIGQVEKQVGLPAKTIRFYEDIGLIAPAQRREKATASMDPGKQKSSGS